MGGGTPPPRSAFTFTYTYNKITRLNCNYDLDFWLRFFLRNDQCLNWFDKYENLDQWKSYQ